MTVVKRVSRNEMIKQTGMDALGYTKPKNHLILVRKGLPKKTEKEVLYHEGEHMKKGEEGPLLGVGAAILGGSVVSGLLGSRAASKQAAATSHAADVATVEQRRQFDLTRQDTAPWREKGVEALNFLSPITQQPMDEFQLGEFEASPGYQFRTEEGQKGVENYLSARGMARSGRGIKEIERFRQGTAADEYTNFFNRQLTQYQQKQADKQNYLANLMNVAGLGQSATNTAVGAGQQTASNIGNYAMQAGAGQAQAYGTQYGALNNAIQGGLSNYLAYQQQQNMMNQFQNAAYRANPAYGDAYMPAYR